MFLYVAVIRSSHRMSAVPVGCGPDPDRLPF